MIKRPIDVLEKYEIRKSKKQKDSFITAVTDYANRAGYSLRVEKGSFGSRNLVIGDPEKAKYLVTAHYDTCAWMPVPNFITPCNFLVYFLYQLMLTIVIFAFAIGLGVCIGVMVESSAISGMAAAVILYGILAMMMVGPANRHTANDNTSGVVTALEIMTAMPENIQDRVAFVFFDLEEAGMIGSTSYRKAHKNTTDHQVILNLDCVGDGDEILFFPTGKLRKDKDKMVLLSGVKGKWGKKTIDVKCKGFAFYPSDQSRFPYGVGIAAFRRAKFVGLYCSRLHTYRDTVLEQSNVNLLCAAIISLIGKK